MEANISEIRMLPEANKDYASYALFHLLSEEYLKNKQFGCISDGYRNLVHETTIQQFLIQKFGFEKVGLKLHVKLKSPWNYIFTILYPFRNLFKKGSIKGVFNLIEFSKCN